MLSRQEKVKAVVNRVLDEFRSDWTRSQAGVLNNQLLTASNSFGAINMGRSNALTFKHRELYEEALSSARDLFVARIEMVLGASPLKPREDLAVALVQACHDELREFSATFDNELVRSQKLMGLGNARIPDTAQALETLCTTTATAVGGAMSHCAESRARMHKPWYERPIGIIALMVVGGLIVWFLTR